MGSSEDPLLLLHRLVTRYQQGNYTAGEIAGYCLEVANEQTVAEVVCALPPDVREHLAERVRGAPITEPDWAKLQLVNFGVVRICDRGGPAESPEAQVARFRTAVEAIRQALLGEEKSQSKPP